LGEGEGFTESPHIPIPLGARFTPLANEVSSFNIMHMKKHLYCTELNISIKNIPLCTQTPQEFQNYIHWYVWSFFQAIEVHANKVPLKIDKRPSNSSLAQTEKDGL
jgi:hypothetical protein